MNEPTIHLSVIQADPEDQKRQDAMSAYLQWLQEAQNRTNAEQFIPLKPRVTRENLYNL